MEQVIPLARATSPDVVLIDSELAGTSLARFTDEVKHLGRAAVVILGTRSEDHPPSGAARADAYANLGDPPVELLNVMRRVSPE
jgi:DNA-binding NarL/FixJ family response regulator